MFSSFKAYQVVDSYWYDKVPSHWKKTKNKYVFNQNKHVVGKDWERLTLLTMGKSGVKPRDLDSGGKFPASFENYQTVEPNQLIFCLFDLDETPRTIGISKDYGMITSAYDVFSSTECNDPNFWTYFYQMIDDHKGLRPFYTGLRKVVRSETFMGIEIFSPPLEEQKLISQYLDKKTKQIDRLVEKIKKKIELLKEQRSSLINQCVTKGLDPNVEMKDSGIEWIERIPKSFTLMKLKWAIDSIKDGTHGTHPSSDDGKMLLSGKNIHDGFLKITNNERFIPIEEHEKIIKNGYPKRGDVLVSSVGSIGRSCVFDNPEPISFQRSVCFIRPSEKLNPYYLSYLIRSHICQTQINTLINQSTVGGIYMGDLTNLYVLIPPINEQLKIVSFLDKKIKKINSLILKIEKSKDLMKEYLQSLISSAVTGKIRLIGDKI